LAVWRSVPVENSYSNILHC